MQNPELDPRHPDTVAVGGGVAAPMPEHLSKSPAAADDDVQEDSVAGESGKVAGGCVAEDPRPEGRPSIVLSRFRKVTSRIGWISRSLGALTPRSSRSCSLDRRVSPAALALMGLKFITEADDGEAAWTEAERRFEKLKSDNGMLPRASFAECIGMDKQSKGFADLLFEALARRKDTDVVGVEFISKAQFKEFWDLIVDQDFDSRLHTFFLMVDKDADGKITEDEIRDIISLSASANSLSNIRERADEFARLIMGEFDPKNRGFIKIETLETILLQAPSYSSAGSAADARQLSQLFKKKLKSTGGPFLMRCCGDVEHFLLDNWQRIWVMALWIAAMAVLYAYKYVQYKNKAVFVVMGHCVCVAKGAAETLKLNSALILLPVCRNTLTWLRNKTRLGAAVSFDDNINFHQVIAVAILIGTLIHVISHMACDFPRLLHENEEKFNLIMHPYFKHQPRSYWEFVKGYEGWTGIAMVAIMAVAFTLAFPWLRRNQVKLPKLLKKLTGFNAFWYSHHLYVVFYVLLVVHGIKLQLAHDWYKKTTWMYLSIPVALYIGERLIRVFRSSTERVEILKVVDHPGKVLQLRMSKPDGFTYKSGQYIFIKCPAVSPFEWHPFSITSAPSDGHLSVHIRIVGDWTQQLKKVFSEAETKAKAEAEANQPNYPHVYIDGPYGAPTQDYKDYEVVLLIGLGIGTTPMISVLKDIINNTKAIDEEKEGKEHALEEGRAQGSSTCDKRNFRTRKAYFYWVTRDQGSFDWFNEVMNEVSEMDHKGWHVVEIHNYCSSVFGKGDARSALIAMIQAIQHAKSGEDVVSGTRVKSCFGKPNWEGVFERIGSNHPNSRIGVFFCGPAKAVKELRHVASKYYSHNPSTKFHFHKENF